MGLGAGASDGFGTASSVLSPTATLRQVGRDRPGVLCRTTRRSAAENGLDCRLLNLPLIALLHPLPDDRVSERLCSPPV